MQISIIDPSLFTLPYDRKLVEGLNHLGHSTTLHGRKLEAHDPDAAGVDIEPSFYNIAGRPIVSRLPSVLRLGVKSVDHVWSMGQLLRMLRKHPPDIIHFQWLPLPMADVTMLSAFRRIAPLVLTVHDTEQSNGDSSSSLQRLAMRRCQHSFDRLIVHTSQGDARLNEQGLGARVAVLPHGLLADLPPARKPDTTDGILTFVLFGKIKPYKGADLLIQAFARLPSHVQARARVRIVGKPYFDIGPLHHLVDEHRLGGQVSIEPTFVPDAEVANLFGPNTVAVFPYREIEASGVLFLALAHGRPIVASRLGSFADLITDGVQGHLTSPGDVLALGNALAHLITDRDFAVSCSNAALDAAASISSWTDIARMTEAVYLDAQAARRTARPELVAAMC